jgi:hypothetical protein
VARHRFVMARLASPFLYGRWLARAVTITDDCTRAIEMIRVKKSKPKARLERDRKGARKAIEAIVDGTSDPYIAYRYLYKLFCSKSGLHDELREFFTIPGIEPDGMIRVDDQFRQTVVNLATDWLSRHPS